MKNYWILCVYVGKRKESALKVQEVLTDFGCYIKTRIGLHDEQCSNGGLIILELIGEKQKHQELDEKLRAIPNVQTKMISFL